MLDDNLSNTTYEIDNTLIHPSENYNDLGIVFDQKLTFNKHISNLIVKAKKLSYLINRRFSFSSADIKVKLFQSYVMPHLDYCSQVWSPNAEHYIKSIEGIQRKFTKTVFYGRYLSYESRLSVSGLMSLCNRCIYLDCCLLFKMLNNNTLAYYNLVRSSSVSRPYDIKQVYYKKRLVGREFTRRIASNWNCLPLFIKEARTIASFKHLYLLHFFSTK